VKRKKDWSWRMIFAVFGLIVCVVCFVLAIDALPVATPVHAAFGWTVDSIRWVHIIGSVRTDSSGKLYSVTEWPDTTFDLSLGHIHQIRFIYWAPGLDSANWQFDFDLYDYNQANCVGGGEFVAGFWIWDTTANDVGIGLTNVSIFQDSSMGSLYKWGYGQANGYVEFGLPNGNYTLLASKPGYGIQTHDFTISSSAYSDTVKGYPIPLPPAVATAPYVKAYYDGGAGFVDSATGLMIPRTNITYYCQTIGAHAFADDSWGIVPQLQKKRPDANGRVTFLVVANLFLTPPTNYYRFWYEARDGRTRVRRTIRNFIVDSLPDPVKILETTEVFPGNY